ncbi:MAG: YdcF family protein [Bacteroidales bacterium]|nr:YdcF family protein [Bacteroidales bacterium]
MKRVLQVSIISIVAVFLMSSCFGQWADRGSKKQYAKEIKQAPFDAIIVPGYPFDGVQWDKIVKLRVVWATHLYKQNITKNIIFSGSAVYTPYVESKIMKAYALALGVPDSVIYTEERAEHTTENVFLSYYLALSKGFKKIALATDPWQSKWMMKFYEKHDIHIDYIPAIIDTIEVLNVGDPKIDTSGTFVQNFTSLTERESFMERWRGTKGKNIDFENARMKEKP